uniref:SCP domain-containing protein n=1 Tax=Chromera velia CCMP2878 TaxID=1169474 RepID=A0A0G4H0P8_9ALVE|eukprot:Cvel_24143.t1-p1 / transcript=Cvel_24143.t1 / gene=Cvel_24143 / organism=Chromera_velia_CCMP2878 / gene_product=Cysteine-rich secretory protein LCCL, putative / transcript_product=Cysteine-rich secretory protein LCCL, putative / location=Cvel_scaffold2576:11487-14184(+) / protein_length=313 / sequence_SO=supercontig / SO=protein_coding / is_pseudo=false
METKGVSNSLPLYSNDTFVPNGPSPFSDQTESTCGKVADPAGESLGCEDLTPKPQPVQASHDPPVAVGLELLAAGQDHPTEPSRAQSELTGGLLESDVDSLRRAELQCPMRSTLERFQREVLLGSNYFRVRSGVGCLAWDAELTTFMEAYLAFRDFTGCRPDHSPKENRRQVGQFENIGENLYTRWGNLPEPSGYRVAQAWWNEVYCYRYGPVGHECVKLDSPECRKMNIFGSGGDVMTGHFTQLLWAQVSHAGCAIHECKIGYKGGGRKWLVGCSYGSESHWNGGNEKGAVPFSPNVAKRLQLPVCDSAVLS